MTPVKCSERMPPAGEEVLVYCDKPVPGRGGSAGWYIAVFDPNPRERCRAFDMKPGEPGWVTTESRYDDNIVLLIENVSEWWELPERHMRGEE